MRVRPSFRVRTRPLASRTCTCCTIAASDMDNDFPSSLTEAGPCPSRSSMSRRPGSASAWKTLSNQHERLLRLHEREEEPILYVSPFGPERPDVGLHLLHVLRSEPQHGWLCRGSTRAVRATARIHVWATRGGCHRWRPHCRGARRRAAVAGKAANNSPTGAVLRSRVHPFYAGDLQVLTGRSQNAKMRVGWWRGATCASSRRAG